MRLFLTIVLFLGYVSLKAQAFTAGLMPDMTLSYKLSENYSIVHKVESRYSGFETDRDQFDIDFERMDFQNFVERKIGLFSKFSIGYQFRINNLDKNEHRLIQQITWSDNLRSFRLGHRIRTDQTFSDTNLPEFRFRYRSKIQLPLQGQKIDQGEYYLSLSDEILFSYLSPDWDFENRVVAKLGFYINDKNKVETGLDWRLDGLLLNNPEHQLWFVMSWYKSL
jgi:hypothetical protein